MEHAYAQREEKKKQSAWRMLDEMKKPKEEAEGKDKDEKLMMPLMARRRSDC